MGRRRNLERYNREPGNVIVFRFEQTQAKGGSTGCQGEEEANRFAFFSACLSSIFRGRMCKTSIIINIRLKLDSFIVYLPPSVGDTGRRDRNLNFAQHSARRGGKVFESRKKFFTL
jgi:hypothetical protein